MPIAASHAVGLAVFGVLLQPLARIDDPAERNWAAEWLAAEDYQVHDIASASLSAIGISKWCA